MKLAALFSGGKDSTWAIYAAQQAGHEIVTLLSLVSRNPHSYMFQRVNLELAPLLAKAMQLPIIMRETAGEKEAELMDLESALREIAPRVDGVSAGALASNYQYDRVAAICKKLGLEVWAPAWQREPEQYWRDLLAAGFRIIITKVACDGLDRSWLGREVTPAVFEELLRLSKKHRFHLGGEGGEFESLVLDCPMYRKRVRIESARTEWQGDSGQYLIDAVLEDK